jgi:hypothetical protein
MESQSHRIPESQSRKEYEKENVERKEKRENISLKISSYVALFCYIKTKIDSESTRAPEALCNFIYNAVSLSKRSYLSKTTSVRGGVRGF